MSATACLLLTVYCSGGGDRDASSTEAAAARAVGWLPFPLIGNGTQAETSLCLIIDFCIIFKQEQTLFKDLRHKSNAIDLQYEEQNFLLLLDELFTMEFSKGENSRKR